MKTSPDFSWWTLKKHTKSGKICEVSWDRSLFIQQTVFNSPEVAQFLNLSIPECRAIVERYYEEEERELFRIREK